MVSDHYAVLFGGVEMEQRDNGVFKQQTCKDGELYILDLKRQNCLVLLQLTFVIFFSLLCESENNKEKSKRNENINIKNKNN